MVWLTMMAVAGAAEITTQDEALEQQLSMLNQQEDLGIINGVPMSKDEWPSAGALVANMDVDVGGGMTPVVNFTCSSTLIAPDVVLTAAHCVRADELAFLTQATSGGFILDAEVTGFGWSRKKDLTGFDLVSSLFGGQGLPGGSVVAADWKYHAKWSLFDLQTGIAKNFDIALVYLSEPVLDTPFALLPSQEEADAMKEGDPVVVVGWGQQAQDPYAGFGVKMGGDSVVGDIGEWEFQVGTSAGDVRKCHGDSGGPSYALVGQQTEFDDGYRVVGVTSHAYDATDCAEKGGVDTRVGFFLDWIDKEMIKACEDGTRSWCEVPGIIQPPDEDGYYAWEENPALAEVDEPDGPNGTGDASGDDDSEGSAKGCNSTGQAMGGWALLGLIGLARRRCV